MKHFLIYIDSSYLCAQQLLKIDNNKNMPKIFLCLYEKQFSGRIKLISVHYVILIYSMQYHNRMP